MYTYIYIYIHMCKQEQERGRSGGQQPCLAQARLILARLRIYHTNTL